MLYFYICATACHTKAALPYSKSFESINAYTDSLMYIWHTYTLYQVSFYSVVLCVYTSTADLNFRRCHQNKVSFFAYSRRRLLYNAVIYTSTLILCNSLNCNLIDLGTMVYLIILYQPSKLYGQKLSVLHGIALIVNNYVNICCVQINLRIFFFQKNKLRLN